MKGKLGDKIRMMILKAFGLAFAGCIFLITGERLWSGRRKNKFSINACLAHMKEKYGIEFTPVEDKRNAEITASMFKFSVQTENYPGQNIFIMQERLDNGNKILFHDNYVAVKYKQQTIELIEKMAYEVFGKDFRVICEVYNHCQPDEFDDTTTFNEFLSRCGGRMIDINILLPPDHSTMEKEEELKKLEQQFIENRVVGFCDVYYSSGKEAYQGIHSATDLMTFGMAEHNHRWYRENGQFVINKEFIVSHEMWR